MAAEMLNMIQLYYIMVIIVIGHRMYLVAKVLNLELPHLVNKIQTQLLWLKPISTPEWLELCCSWMYFCQMTWDIYSRCILRCFRIVNGIIKAKEVCRMTFGKKDYSESASA